jgi:Tfp pilus assembly protein PilN
MKLGRTEPKLVVGGVPRVDLLPPEVHARRQDGRLNRMLVLVLVAAVVLSGGVVLGAKLVADGSAANLAGAQARTAQLLAQQRRYSTVSSTKSRLAATRAARATVAGHVIDWRGYLRSVSATLPAGVHVAAATVEAAGATTTGAAAAGVAAPPGTVATLTLQVRTAHWTAVQDWLTALPALRGFLDASPTTVSADALNGVTATVVVHVGEAAYGAPPAGAAAIPAVAGPTPSPAATATPSPSPSRTAATPNAAASASSDATAAPTTRATPEPARTSAAPLAAGATGGNG